MSSSSNRARRRIPNACRICRQRKVKCDGKIPCSNCVSRGHECVFDEAEKKVVILEKHLRALQRRVSDHQLPATNDEAQSQQPDLVEQNVAVYDDGVPVSGGFTDEQSTLPLTRTPPRIFKAFSPWNHLAAAIHVISPVSDTQAGPEQLRRSHDDTTTSSETYHGSTNALFPGGEFTEHLVHTVDFHLNRVLFFFNPTELLTRLTSTKVRTLEDVSQVHLTINEAQLLIVVALGKLFREKDGIGANPPGLHEFWAVERTMPASSELLRQPMVAAEVLCMLAWYAQAIERHDLAHLHIGQALGVLKTACLFSTSENTSIERDHCFRIRRTAQVLETRLLATMGKGSARVSPGMASSGASESSEMMDVAIDLSAILQKACGECDDPSQNSQRHGTNSSHPFLVADAALDHVAASLKEMQSVGLRMSKIEVRSGLTTGTSNRLIRGLRELHLWFCHCIVVVTLPAVLQEFNQELLALGRARSSQDDRKGMVEICVRYSYLGLRMLVYLYDQGFSECFSYFNLELLVLVSIILILTRASLEGNTVTTSLVDQARTLLDNMAHRGSEAASKSANGLDYLEACAAQRDPRMHIQLDPSIAAFEGKLLDREMLTTSGLSQHLEHDFRSPVGMEAHNSPVQSVDNLPPLTSGPYLEALGPGGGDFSFDMEDLQWLDAVQ